MFIFFTGDNNTQKMMISNETRLTVAITDLIISEVLSFNLSQKSRFKKVLDFSRAVSKSYQPPNTKFISLEVSFMWEIDNILTQLLPDQAPS